MLKYRKRVGMIFKISNEFGHALLNRRSHDKRLPLLKLISLNWNDDIDIDPSRRHSAYTVASLLVAGNGTPGNGIGLRRPVYGEHQKVCGSPISQLG